MSRHPTESRVENRQASDAPVAAHAAVVDAWRAAPAAPDALDREVGSSRLLSAVAHGLEGPSLYRGLDQSHPANGEVRDIVDQSIKLLEARLEHPVPAPTAPAGPPGSPRRH
jgi:hypothetical protein